MMTGGSQEFVLKKLRAEQLWHLLEWAANVCSVFHDRKIAEVATVELLAVIPPCVV
jgi:hypothetical protein